MLYYFLHKNIGQKKLTRLDACFNIFDPAKIEEITQLTFRNLGHIVNQCYFGNCVRFKTLMKVAYPFRQEGC